MGLYQRTPKKVARAIRYSGLGVRSVGPVGDFLHIFIFVLFVGTFGEHQQQKLHEFRIVSGGVSNESLGSGSPVDAKGCV